jgi:hypothetical protein
MLGAYKSTVVPRGNTGAQIFTACSEFCSGYRYMSLGMQGLAKDFHDFPATSCTCGFRFQEYTETAYAMTEDREQATCAFPTTFVGGSTTCVKVGRCMLTAG